MYPASGASVDYVWPDNLDTPRAVTNAAGQLLWQWDGEPFGASPANSNPAGLGTFRFSLRFPGQYFDWETGLHHNGWREYDPQQGRYIQSDPTGLVGSLNTYAYAANSPLTLFDPLGQSPADVGKLLSAGLEQAAAMRQLGYIVTPYPGISQETASSWGNFTIDWGGNTTRMNCFDQSHELLSGLQTKLRRDGTKLDDSWQFGYVSQYYPWKWQPNNRHQWAYAESSNVNDPYIVIDIDTWKGIYRTVPRSEWNSYLNQYSTAFGAITNVRTMPW